MKPYLLYLGFVLGIVPTHLNLAQGQLKLPNILGDHMVFQQGMPIVVWGWGKPGEEVKVSLGGIERRGKVYADGKWVVKLPARSAGGPYELKVASGGEEIIIRDVMIGEVWVCSGQSNMEWPVASSNNAQEEISKAHYPQIRLFTVSHSVSLTPKDDCEGRWEVCSPNTVGSFSAVGYFFGREIHEKLRVPVGLINASWGGTPAEVWTDLETLKSDPDFKPLLERIKKESIAAEPPQTPTVLYNAMIHPLLPFRIRGVIWYQGESNLYRAYQYRKLFPAMIQGWRKAWKEGDFPFLFVQLANIGERSFEPTESAWAELREAQLLTLRRVPNVGMAVTIDIGEANDVHPRNKQDVGKRLAMWALALTYGQKVEYASPIYKGMKIEGDKVRIFFDHTNGGLVAKGGELKGFAIAGADRKFHWAKARIEGDTVVVWSEKVPRPVAVRYAWADNPDCNLYNKAGLPASPFRTDDWRQAWIGGYMIAGVERVDQSYNAGFSMYSAAWPLLKDYPGHEFQSGLFGTWMFPFREKQPEEGMYSDIEGGLGWWRDTAFPTIFPKFIMGGVQLNFVGWANTPGSGAGEGKYGVVQLSPWLLFPPDGLNLKQGTCGKLFGYGYLPLPLTEVKPKTAGRNFPTGNQWWTLFINTANFKGPVAAFTPFFWSQVGIDNPKARGMFLDILPSDANKAYEMETQYIHCVISTDSKGERYLRCAPIQFPIEPDGTSVIMNRLMVYKRGALWDKVKKWFEGGPPVEDSIIDATESCVQKFNGNLWATWAVYQEGEEKRVPIDISSFFSVDKTDPTTLRLRWDLSNKLLTVKKREYGTVVVLPEYYRLVNDKWVAVSPEEVPPETGLKEVTFAKEETLEARVTPAETERDGKGPGPVAGPFKVKLGDGSTVTYYWYRFADQPALLHADFTPEEREELQKKVEELHKLWTKEREYLLPPTVGELAEIDPALLVTPPKGLEIGYVPIAARQEMEK